MNEFDYTIIAVIMVTVAGLLCYLLTHEDKVYVIHYNQCLYDEYSDVSLYYVVARVEGLFSTKEKKYYLPYRSTSQGKNLSKRLEESMKNKTPFK